MTISWIKLLKRLVLGLAWAGCLGAAAQSLEVTTATELRATPALDAKVLAKLAKGTKAERLGAQGGWYQVNSGGHEGWLRSTHVRTVGAVRSAAATGAVTNPITGLMGMFSATTSTPTATTGTRGLTHEQLANAKPAPGEVRQLERFAVTGEQARQFAAGGGVVAHPFPAYTGADR